jgi:hypothetical protein
MLPLAPVLLFALVFFTSDAAFEMPWPEADVPVIEILPTAPVVLETPVVEMLLALL